MVSFRPWEEQVLGLGVSPSIIEFARLQSSGDSVIYPCQFPPRIVDEDGETRVIYDESWRGRTLPDAMLNDPEKDRFHNRGGKTLPMFYTPNYNELRKAVAAAQGTLNLFEGDRDLWTAMSAGLMNSAQFKDLGVKVIKMYPDADHSGWNLCERLQAVLTKYGIHIFFYRLPYFSNNSPIKDTSDLWLALEQDAAKFVKQLQSLPTLVLIDESDKKDNRDVFIPEYYDEIENKLDIDGEDSEAFNAQGWSKLRACIVEHHAADDIRPAFSWNKKLKIGRCFKCGQTWLAKDVGEYLNINWRLYLNAKPLSEKETKLENERVDRAGELSVASSLFKGMHGGVSDYSAVPSSEIMFSLDDAIDDYEKRLAGLKVSEFPPIMNPITAIHHLGGTAKVITRPKLITVLGASGGFKTSLLTWIVNRMSLMGYHGIVYSPEWAPEKNADRIIQQLGGLKMFETSLHERAAYEEMMMSQGLMTGDDLSRFGVRASDEQLEKTRRAMMFMRKKFRGKVFYMRQFGANVLEVLAQIRETAHRMTMQNCPPSFLIFDYAQMAIAPTHLRSTWSMQDTITYTKALTMQLGLATWMSSQVRKSDTQDANKSQTLLNSESGLGFRIDQANLAISLTRMPDYHKLPDGRTVVEVKLAVDKNSDGEKAEGDKAISIFVDVNTMNVVMRGPDKTLVPMMEIDPNDPDLIEEE